MTTLVQAKDYDPMMMYGAALAPIFNAVVAEVGPKELQAYIDAIKLRDGAPLAPVDHHAVLHYPKSLAQSFSVVISMNLLGVLGQPGGTYEAQRVREALIDMGAEGAAHYMSQVRPVATAQDAVWNAHTALHAAVYRTFCDQLALNLSQ